MTAVGIHKRRVLCRGLDWSDWRLSGAAVLVRHCQSKTGAGVAPSRPLANCHGAGFRQGNRELSSRLQHRACTGQCRQGGYVPCLGLLPPATWAHFCRASYFTGMLGVIDRPTPNKPNRPNQSSKPSKQSRHTHISSKHHAHVPPPPIN